MLYNTVYWSKCAHVAELDCMAHGDATNKDVNIRETGMIDSNVCTDDVGAGVASDRTASGGRMGAVILVMLDNG